MGFVRQYMRWKGKRDKKARAEERSAEAMPRKASYEHHCDAAKRWLIHECSMILLYRGCTVLVRASCSVRRSIARLCAERDIDALAGAS